MKMSNPISELHYMIQSLSIKLGQPLLIWKSLRRSLGRFGDRRKVVRPHLRLRCFLCSAFHVPPLSRSLSDSGLCACTRIPELKNLVRIRQISYRLEKYKQGATQILCGFLKSTIEDT